MDDSSVIKWIPYTEIDSYQENGLGGMGGWFSDGMRWDDYVDGVGAPLIFYAESLRHRIIKDKIRHGGDWHQSSDQGVPLFADGTIATFSYRAWGDILAAIWSTEDQKDYSYMDFYMCGWGKADCGCVHE